MEVPLFNLMEISSVTEFKNDLEFVPFAVTLPLEDRAHRVASLGIDSDIVTQ